MRRRTLTQLLIAEGVVIFIFALMMSHFSLTISSVFSFPFEQIAIGLKHLSNMGSAIIPFVSGLISSFQMQMPILDKSFRIMRLIVACIPKVFYVWIIARAFLLIDVFVNEKEYLEDHTKKLQNICIRALLSMAALNTGFNFVQLYFMRSLSHLICGKDGICIKKTCEVNRTKQE